MLHTKLYQNWPSGSWKVDFYSVFTIYGHGSHLGHVTCKMLMIFHLLVPTSLHSKFGLKWASGFLEKKDKSSSINDIGPKSNNELDLQYSHIFIKSISLRSQAAIVSE